MKSKRMRLIIVILIIFAATISACSGAATTSSLPSSSNISTTPSPIASNISTITSLPTVGKIEGGIGIPDIKVTICDKLEIQLPGNPLKCTGNFSQSVVTDWKGYFMFPAIPPGEYYIFFDIPEKFLKDITPPLCAIGGYYRYDNLPEGGVREFYLNEDLTPPIVVEAGKTTYISRTTITIE